MGKVLIKCIQTPMQKYFYDRSLDSVVMVIDIILTERRRTV